MLSSWAVTESIDTDECLRLLATTAVGRVAFSLRALPAVLPVRYRLQDGRAVFAVFSPMHFSALSDGVAALEVDELDAESGAGWMVTVVGRSTSIVGEAPFVVASGRTIGLSIDRVTGERSGSGPGIAPA